MFDNLSLIRTIFIKSGRKLLYAVDQFVDLEFEEVPPLPKIGDNYFHEDKVYSVFHVFELDSKHCYVECYPVSHEMVT